MKHLFCAALTLAFATSASAQYGDISDLKLAKPEDAKDVEKTPAPEGAVVLFAGDTFENWRKSNGKGDITWNIVDGAMRVTKGGGITSKKKFAGHFHLHVEFRVPYMPKASGQGRGNSGVYVQGRYEVQVLDSYGLKSKYNDCGGIYEVAAPLVNACKAPTVWQSYDIEFWAPECDNGKKTSMPKMTVHHNGVKIHDKVEINKDNTRAGLGGDVCTPGPIYLQDHGNPVEFRNIWVKQLD